MEFKETHLKGCFIIEPKVIQDGRGYFMESFNQQVFNNGLGRELIFVQDNQSESSKGVVRGLHYQTGSSAQAKLVRVLEGEVLDVAVDIRPDSPTYGQHVSVVLSAENKTQFFVPEGFAHGFSVLSEKAVFFYKCSNFYDKASEGGILYNDPALGIDWMLKESEIILSEKDKNLPVLEQSRKAW